MVFVKTVIQKNRKKQNQTKQNENCKKTDKNCNIYREYANKKKEQKYPSKKNHSMDQSVFKSIRS